MTDSLSIIRLRPEHADAVVGCFNRVYGDTYANPLFYQADKLSESIASGRLCCVGALAADGTIVGHMAMSLGGPGDTPELGNTVVDPDARGGGVAWQVGAELTAWCQELGFHGFLHYPTADHHIMQRQSVKRGFETGLMLGYIPAETHGKVGRAGEAKRQAATIVYEPFSEGARQSSYLCSYGAQLIRNYAERCRLPRNWLTPERQAVEETCTLEMTTYEERGLARLAVLSVGRDMAAALNALEATELPCLQIDLSMSDAGIQPGVDAARLRGFVFSGWLPGYRSGDVLRLQKVRAAVTNIAPDLVNDAAQNLLRWISR